MERTAVYAAIDSERDHQDAKWGPPAEHLHEVGAWLELMEVHVRRGLEAWAGARGDDAALECVRKALAIGVACGEQHGLPPRSRGQAVVLPAEAPAKPRLVGWRTSDFLNETDDIDKARSWSSHHDVLPIFEGDPYTRLSAGAA